MGFKEVSGLREYRGWRKWSEGDFVIGTYSDDGEQNSDYGMQRWFDIEVIESNFGLPSGKTLRLNGNGALNSKMDEITHGTKIKVQFDGYNTLTKGKFAGKEFADVKVFVSDEQSATQKSEPEYSGL